MFEQDSTLAHQACEKVDFLDRETSDFMTSYCLVLTRTLFISEPDYTTLNGLFCLK